MPPNTEIERRFVILQTNPTAIPALVNAMRIHQGIIRGDKNHMLRVRTILQDGVDRAILTFKEGQGIMRVEIEESLGMPAARLLLSASLHTLRKTRYNLDDGGELDIFDGVFSGLTMIEYELESADQPVTKPDWIVEWVEVTDLFTNSMLSSYAMSIRELGLTKDTVTRGVLDFFTKMKK
jgi:adenylate cyclase